MRAFGINITVVLAVALPKLTITNKNVYCIICHRQQLVSALN